MNPIIAASIQDQIAALSSTADFYAARATALRAEAEDFGAKETETRAKIAELEEAMA